MQLEFTTLTALSSIELFRQIRKFKLYLAIFFSRKKTAVREKQYKLKTTSAKQKKREKKVQIARQNQTIK